MKRKLITAVLAVVMLVSSATCAWADNAIPDAQVGQVYDQLLPGTEGAANYWMATLSDNTVSQLPAGLHIEAPLNSNNNLELHLAGTPTTAGYYNFKIGVLFGDGSTNEIAYSLNINSTASPSVPVISASGDISCSQGSSFTVNVSASGNGTLSYQWYSVVSAVNYGGSPVPGATQASLTLQATVAEEAWYYCVVTNTLSGSYASATSAPIHVSVTAAETAVKEIFNVTRLTDPAKTEYKAGEKPDLTGLTVGVQYTDGSYEVVSDSSLFTVEPKTLSAGTSVLTISIGDYSFMIPVSVKNTVELVAPPDKVNYRVGDALDTNGMIIRVFSGSGYTDITSGFTCSPTTLTRTGNQNITVIYEGDSVTFSVYVEAAVKDTKLEILTSPSKLEYNVGDTLDTSGLTLRLWTGDEYKDISYGFSCSPNVLGEAGDAQVITVRYGTASTTFTVSVKGEEADVTPEPTSTPSTITVAPSEEKKDTGSSAPVAVIIIAVIIAGAALAGAVTYISLLKKSRDEQQSEPEEEDEFNAEQYFPQIQRNSVEEKSAVPAEQKPRGDLTPDKKDYFEGLFDDK